MVTQAGEPTGPESPPGAADPDGASLTSELRLAVLRLTRRMRAQRLDHKVTLSQLSALSCLSRHDSMTPGELAAGERVQPPSMTRVIAALEEAGLATRRPHPSDGRQAIVEITDSGRAYLAEEVTARERWLDQRLAELTEDERAVLARATGILNRISGS